MLSSDIEIGKVWLAAHWEKKLSRNAVVKANVDRVVEYIIDQNNDVTLRPSAVLLLGIARIIYRKTEYVLNELYSIFSDLTESYDKR